MGKKDPILDDFVTADQFPPSTDKEDCDIHNSKEVRTVRTLRTNYEHSSELLTVNVTEAELRLLKIIVRLDREGEANINNKLLQKEAKLSKAYISELLSRLRKKDLIQTADQATQKIRKPTMKGLTAVTRQNGGSSDNTNSPQKLRTNYEHSSSKTYTLRVRPHDVRFKAEIVKGPPFENESWKTYILKGRIDRICYEYECTCVFYESTKSGKRWVQVYVPSFFSDDVKLSVMQSHKKALKVLRFLKKDYGYQFSDLVLTHAHIAVQGDPLSYYAPERGLIQDKEGRFQLDNSPGFKEFEAVTKLAEKDMEKVLNDIILPVAKGEYNPMAALRHIRIAQSQIKRSQDVLSQRQERLDKRQEILDKNQYVFSENLVSHVKLVSSVTSAAESVERAALALEEQIQQSRKSILQKLRESGQKFIEDFL